MIALKDIEEGEEINLCYLDDAEELPLETRKETLRDFYLFDCQCERCKKESSEAAAAAQQEEEEPEDRKGKSTKRRKTEN